MKKYYSLYRTVKEKILSGEYRAGEKLPSKRVMADMTGYSLITVEAAYAMLCDEGYITPRQRSGYYVCPMDVATPKGGGGAVKLDYLCDSVTEEGSDFEYSVWFKTVRKVIADGGERLFVRSPSEGCAVLRNAIADYLYRYRGMVAQPRQIIIGSGAEQLYETAVKLLGRDRIFGIEDPSYGQISAVYEGMGVDVRRLRMGEDGIESTALMGCEGLDVLHVTPFNSYPSGVTTSVRKRYEYLAWAREGERYIIEDDFDSEFFLPGQPIESLYSLDTQQSVIYINTFSKSLSPSMRMGYMILPDALLDEYNRRLSAFTCTVPVLEQYVLSEFIAGGSFERHLNRMRRRLGR